MKKNPLLLVLLVAALGASLNAQTTPSSNNPNPIVIDMIPSTRNPGEVPTFYISKHAVSPEAYCAFLNAVDTVAGCFYHREWNDVTSHLDLLTIAQTRDEASGLYSYSLINEPIKVIATTTNGIPLIDTDPETGEKRAVFKTIPARTIMKGVPMADAARFCNWLSKNQPIGFIGDATTESGSYTLVETRERQTNDSMLAQIMYDPKFPKSDRLKNSYMSVNRTTGATWRLPTRKELGTVLSPTNWGSLDSVDEKSTLWYWTEDSYLMDFPPSMQNPYHTPISCNTGGYHRIKGAGANNFNSSMDYHKFQNEFVRDTGFCVVFEANKGLPVSGFRMFVPSPKPVLPPPETEVPTPTQL
jgi:hypothetical protein